MRNRVAWAAISIATLMLPVAANAQWYRQTNLVSDGFVPAVQMDPHLVNPWGLATGPTTPFWVADNGTGLSTLYNTAGDILSLVVTIPTTSAPGADVSAPTGLVFNGGSGFMVTNGTAAGPSRFIFVTEGGTIAGWSPTVDPTNAIVAVDNSGSGAIYKGAALARSALGTMLFATNFHSGMVDVFNDHFQMIGSFRDSAIPSNYAPFGIANVDGLLVVTFTQQDANAEDDVPGPGHGFVDVFNSSGRLVRHFAARGPLNSPWGVSMAPNNFGRFQHALLIGNFGDGRINAYNPRSGALLGHLESAHGQPIEIDGLWALLVGNGHAGGDANKLYFTAGVNDENDGLFGSLQAVHR
jgi:uncharacterized protein (TIGR03118 family)